MCKYTSYKYTFYKSNFAGRSSFEIDWWEIELNVYKDLIDGLNSRFFFQVTNIHFIN